MKLADFVVRDAVIPDLVSTTKEDVIREMVGCLLAAGSVAQADHDAVIKAVLKREEQGTTGIGRGVAVPHTKHGSASRLSCSVALSRRGVDFASLDGEPVHIFFLLISPADRPGDHLRALESISRQLRNDSFCRFLRQSTTKQQVLELLDEADQNQFSA